MGLEIRGSDIVVVGAGRSGLALARYLAAAGARVTLSDQRRAAALAGLEELAAAGVAFDLGGHSEARFAAADLIVISPGVPLNLPALAAAAGRGTPIIGEIELAFQQLSAPLVAVAGTNGKSTVTTLIGLIFSHWGKKTFVGGNLGTPLISAAAEKDWEWIVAEVSSFQLEAIRTFRPRCGLLLNITEDHLNRYGTMENYIAAKARIYENQTAGDFCVLNYDNGITRGMAKQPRSRIIWFSRQVELDFGVFIEEGNIVSAEDDGKHVICRADEVKIPGVHNLENALAATALARCYRIPPDVIRHTLMTFPGVEHRIEFVRELDGVRYINDS